MGSGDDIRAGRATSAESTTFLTGAIPSELDVDFNGDFFMEVGPLGGALSPRHEHSGIRGSGSNAQPPTGTVGGTGVQGIGGAGGTGVQGTGGAGGTGVDATGGDGLTGNGGAGLTVSGGEGRQSGGGSIFRPGEGIVARGGGFSVSEPTSGSSRTPNGPGLVAAAGQSTTPAQTGNVGIFGQGGNEISKTVKVLGGTVVLGPDSAGAGVVGRGGKRMSDSGIPDNPLVAIPGGGSGVLGIAGDTDLPVPSNGIGVLGVSRSGPGVAGSSGSNDGVKGNSRKGSGVTGHSVENAGGIFSSGKKAQLRIIPNDGGNPNTAGIPGDPGDILVTLRTDPELGRKVATLWFRAFDDTGGWAVIA